MLVSTFRFRLCPARLSKRGRFAFSERQQSVLSQLPDEPNEHRRFDRRPVDALRRTTHAQPVPFV